MWCKSNDHNGQIYKSKFVDLVEISSGRKNSRAGSCDLVFARNPEKPELAKYLDEDGLPYPGVPLFEDDPMFCYYNRIEEVYIVKKYLDILKTRQFDFYQSYNSFDNNLRPVPLGYVSTFDITPLGNVKFSL